jgi:hypothetical protein
VGLPQHRERVYALRVCLPLCRSSALSSVVTPALLVLLACPPVEPTLGEGKGDDTDTPAETGDTGDTAPDPDGDLDQDGDGYTPNQGDCDDTLPHVHPGAPDYCDGLDQDCDGEPIPDGSCSLDGDPTAMWTWSFPEPVAETGSLTQPAGDLDGDGLADFTAQGRFQEEGVFTSKALARQAAASPLPEFAWGISHWPSMRQWPAPDTNGDGYDDLWVTTVNNAGRPGPAMLLLGGPTFGEPTGLEIEDAAAAIWTDEPTLRFSPMSWGDFNGDGGGDLLVALYDENGAGTEAQFAVLPSDPAPTGGPSFSHLPLLDPEDDATGIVWVVTAVSDLDGDGMDEAYIPATNGRTDGRWDVLFVSGADLMTGGDILDVATVLHPPRNPDEALVNNWSRVRADPDYNGDGLADVALGSNGARTCALLLTGGLPAGEVDDLAYLSVCGGEDQWIRPRLWGDDVDDDGIPDLMVWPGCPLPSSRLLPGGAYWFDDLQLPCITGPTIVPNGMVDMTGDGLAEWVINENSWEYPAGSGDRYPRSLIIKGFPIPWDDPAKW